MKKYIILTYVIGNMGGAQIYCRNKLAYCQDNGYECFLFPSEERENVYIQELQQYCNNVCQEFKYVPQIFSKKTIEKVIDWVKYQINYKETDEIIIESHTIMAALWGEVIAEKLSGKHFVFLLTEDVDKFDMYELHFLEYKRKRKELACIKKEVTKQLFQKLYSLSDDECYALRAICGNSVEDVAVPEKYSELGNAAIVIGIIGRLNKPYVKKALERIVLFAKEHQDEKVEVIVIGGGADEVELVLENVVKCEDNIQLQVTGYMYPIPKKLIEKMDVCIAGAGSVIATCELVPTISVDVYSCGAIGVYGYDTESILISDSKKSIFIEQYIEKIVYGDFLKTHAFSLTNRETIDKEEQKKALEEHFVFINNSVQSLVYYDCLKKKTMKQRLIAIIYLVGGMKLLKGCRKFVGK